MRGPIGPVWALALSPDGKTAVTSGADRLIRIWDASYPRDTNSLEGHRSWVNAVAFSPDSKTLGSVDYYQNTVKLWDVASRRFICDLPGHTNSPSGGGVAFSPDGRFIAATSYSGLVRLFAAGTHELLTEFTNQFIGGNVSFSPDSKVLALSSGYVLEGWPEHVPSLIFWDVNKRVRLDRLTNAALDASAVRFSPNGRLVAVSSQDGFVRLWEWDGGRLLKEFRSHTCRLPALEFSADGTLLASAGEDDTVVVYSVTTLQVIAAIKGHTGGAKCLAFAPDGKTLAVGCNDGAIRLSNLESRQVALVLRKHVGNITGVSFSADGRFLASSDGAAKVRLWPAASFQEAAAELSASR
jgi:WD40 repeat protein